MAYKIAFHLGRGKNFMHWQIKDSAGNVSYVDPETNDIVLHECTLRNQKSASLRIYNGGEKNRCAWVEFERYEVTKRSNYTSFVNVRFNPRVSPTWQVNGNSEQDGRTFSTLRTNSKNLYA